MATSKTMAVLPDDAESTSDLAFFLNDQEQNHDREVVDFGLAQSPSGKFNVCDYVLNAEAFNLPRISVFPIPSDNQAADALRQLLATNTALAYTPALIGGVQQDVLIARQGSSVRFVGKMSTFGGPNDTGMTPTEGLAIVGKSQFAQFREFFLPGATAPLGRSLNPDKFYIACRWDRNVTPYSWLRQNKVLVRNPSSGASFPAQPMDWGPAAWTARVADLSPGLAKALNLKTDDLCEIVVPVPVATATPATFAASRSKDHNTLVSVANRQFTLFHGVDENDQPLQSQIESYWTELNFAFPANGVETPWSAVFVSWCVKQAGATSAEFKFDPTHAVYIKAAIKAATDSSGTFRAFPIDKYAPKVGDLIHANRESGTITYKQAATKSSYPSHTAIVVALGEGRQGRFALTIGGNEGDSVRQAEVLLDGNGLVQPRTRNPFISVVRTFDSAPNPA